MSRVTVNPYQLQVLDRIIHLDAVVVGITNILGGKYKRIKHNLKITLSDNRVILARERLLLNVHKSGQLTVPWKRVELPYTFEVERPEPKLLEAASVTVFERLDPNRFETHIT
jgi:hypothetical protein